MSLELDTLLRQWLQERGILITACCFLDYAFWVPKNVSQPWLVLTRPENTQIEVSRFVGDCTICYKLEVSDPECFNKLEALLSSP
jgi:hypothetical protein